MSNYLYNTSRLLYPFSTKDGGSLSPEILTILLKGVIIQRQKVLKRGFKMKIDNKLKIFGIYAVITFLAIIMAFNYQLFIVENKYAPAGLNGIATMIQYKTGFSIGFFSLFINIPLCILAFFGINKQYAVRTLWFSVVYSVSYLIVQKIGFSEFQYNANGKNVIFPVIISGLISGTVYGILFYINSSTGGTDVISKFVSTKKPKINFFWITFILNSVVALSSFFVYSEKDSDGNMIYNYLPICLCAFYCYVASYVGNNIIKGTKKACEFTIITSHPEEIAERITNELKHGCTKLTAVGAFSNNEKTVLLCVINNQQIYDLRRILSQYPDTFSFAETVFETYGNFKKIK